MPTSISIALVSMFLYLVVNLIIGGAAVLQGTLPIYLVVAECVLALLIVLGTMRGNRLAWQGGRLSGLVGFAYYAYMAGRLGLRPQETLGLGDRLVELSALGLQAVCLLIVYFAFDTQTARSHFEMICPRCGESSGITNGDLFYNTMHCKHCKSTF